MDDQRNEGDKLDEVLLPGFRFHPTDEELVAFYLRRKIQQRPLSIELIKQLDIYKYDPWDLPKLATTGEKEWYFYCPRDRKYRNSVRPNRVTGAGFWKATGTDRPIYSSQGSKCIGLKKSLVFYKGRAAKGIKTDWMMHEFRLPSLLTDSAAPAAKRLFDKNHIPANDSWAICRIFKKTTSTAQRTLSHSWVVSPYPESTPLEHIPSNQRPHYTRHGSSDNDPFTAQFSTNNNDLKHSFNSCFTPQYVPPSKPITAHQVLPISNTELTNSSLPFSPFFNAAGPPGKCAVDVSSMLLNMSSPSALLLGGFGESVPEEVHNNNNNNSDLSSLLPLQEMVQYKNLLGEGEESHGLMMKNQELHGNAQWGALQWCNGFPHSLPLLWDSSPCPSDISTSFSTNKPPN